MRGKNVNLLFKPDSSLETRIEKMSQKFKQRQEAKFKAISMRLSQEQIS